MKYAAGPRDIRNRSDKPGRAGQLAGQKVTNNMNNEHESADECQRPNVMNTNSREESTYALLVRSNERSRDILENALFAVFVLSALFAIWQFAVQPNALPLSRVQTATQHTAVHRVAS
jgi:hypothetical protein